MDIDSVVSKSVIYGGNFIAGAVGRAFDYNLANPSAAIAYGALDIARGCSDKVNSSVFTKLANVGGAVFFVASTVNDLFSILNKDYSAIAQLPFNASMALQLTTNASEGVEIIEGFRGLKRSLETFATGS